MRYGLRCHRRPVSDEFVGVYYEPESKRMLNYRQENKQFGWDGEKADMPDWVTDIDNGSQSYLCRRYFGKSFGQAVFEGDIEAIKAKWAENPYFESDEQNIRQMTVKDVSGFRHCRMVTLMQKVCLHKCAMKPSATAGQLM